MPKVENGISNFATANDLVTAWAIEATSNSDKANEWIDREIKKLAGNKTLLWVREAFNHNQAALPDNNDPTIRLLIRLMRLEENKPFP